MRCNILNFRAFLLVALFVTVTVFCVYCYAFNRVAGLTLGIILLVCFAVLSVIFILLFIFNKVRLVVAISCVLATLLSVCAFTVGVVVADKWAKGAEIDGYCSVYGRVCDVDTQSGYYRLYLDDLVLNGKSADGILRLDVSVSDHNIVDTMNVGDSLQLGAYIIPVKLADEGNINGSSYRTDTRYTASVRSDGIVQRFGEPKPLEKFSLSLRGLLTDNMGDKYGNIAFSMLTGDKYGLNTGVFDYFSAAGLGHIMAVSGLHIGFFVLLLNLILCKLSKKIRFSIIAVVLAAYAVLADFSPSVIRAVIMVYISGMGVLIGGRRDLLSSLFCAYSFILAVKPFYMFEVGFLLSFGALFGIAVFSNIIKRFAVKHGAPNKIGSSIGGSIAASFGILPAEMYFFGTVHFLAFIINMIVIPYISVVFISIVVTLPIAAIPNCGVVLNLGKYLLMPLDYVAYGIAHIPHIVIESETLWTVFLCYPVMFSAGEHVMLGKSKTAVGWYAVAVCIAIILLSVL